MSYQLSVSSTPNRSARIGHPIYMVIHRMQGGYAGSVSWLRNPASEASADECLSRDGRFVTVLNYASSGLKTWEVGGANSLCVGFEIEGYEGDEATLPDHLFDTLAKRLVKMQEAVARKYGVTIPLKHSTRKGQPGIVSHYQISQWAYGGTDHTDGKAFPWARLATAIARVTAQPPAPQGEPEKPQPGYALEVVQDGKIKKHLLYGGNRVSRYLAGSGFAKLLRQGRATLIRHKRSGK